MYKILIQNAQSLTTKTAKSSTMLLMIWLRKFVLLLLSLALLIALVGGAVSTSSNIAFTHPDKLEAWLDQSHFYDHFINNAIDQAQKSAINSSGAGQVSLSDPAVKAAAQTAFSPQLLKQDVNTILNSNYAWLQGKTSSPDFKINLTSVKQSFADAAGKAVETHLTGLPACTAAQLQQLAASSQNVQSVDPLSLPCLPPGVNPQTEAAQVSQDILNNDNFLSGHTVITASSINPNGSSQSKPYYVKLSRAPTLYRASVALPWVYAVLAVISLLGVIFLAPTKRRGFRRFGVVLFEAGIILVAVKFAADQVLPHVETKVFNAANVGPLQQSLTNFIHLVESQLTKVDLWFGIAYLVLAVIILVYLLATRNRTPKAVKATPTPQSEAPKVAPVAKPRPASPTPGARPARPARPKPPRLIQ